MKFRASPANRPTRVIAALAVLALAATSVGVAPGPVGFAGGAISAAAICVLCAEGLAFVRERWRRRDKYDLTLLDDTRHYEGPSHDDPGRRPETPAWESEEDDVVYCHRCDVSMPTFHSICPKCGCPLGR